AAGEGWTNWLLPMDLPLREWPSVALDAVDVAAIRRGQSVAAPSSAPGRYRLIDPEGRLLAWAEVDAAHRLQPRAVFSTSPQSVSGFPHRACLGQPTPPWGPLMASIVVTWR